MWREVTGQTSQIKFEFEIEVTVQTRLKRMEEQNPRVGIPRPEKGNIANWTGTCRKQEREEAIERRAEENRRYELDRDLSHL
ncbi:hypothetical protein PGTUg99_031178 [Puccinia graminis f. sp. tritici]|uniref:Uncharacterized protein n=1 Tax=Puccinia graminis f. sp. tritici TaxID=56615 RepID=A0A5B0QTC6_PUCGR|nr:hypothetical protein PGTUg99_031178 [Puccinia graminis f. sp. tritici]